MAWELGNKLEDEADKYLDIAEENLEWLEEKKYDSTMILSYRAAFYGFRIGINNWYVTLYGLKQEAALRMLIRLTLKTLLLMFKWQT